MKLKKIKPFVRKGTALSGTWKPKNNRNLKQMY